VTTVPLYLKMAGRMRAAGCEVELEV